MPGDARTLVAAAAPHAQPLFIFLLGTGARLGEAISLDWRNVDLAGNRAIFWKTKNGQRRVAALPPVVIAALRHLAEAAEASREDRTKVFVMGRGLPYTDHELGGGHIKTAWKGAIRRAGLDSELTPHDLRHTWASWHYAVHRDLLALKVEGGWSSIKLVERYAHLLPTGHVAEIRHFWDSYVLITADPSTARSTAGGR